MLASILKAILEWLTSIWREDKKASDAPDVPSHIRERFRDRVRKHKGGFRGINRKK
jgi:hypothetical protein